MGNTKSKSKGKSSTVINISNAKETETVTPVNEAASNDPITTPIPQSLPLPNTSRTENETKHERGGGSAAVASMQLQGTANAVDRDMSECTNVVSSDILNCSNCNKPFNKLQDDRHQFLCPCKTTRYCNTACQKAHWKQHKTKHREIVKKDTLMKYTGSIKKKPDNKPTPVQISFGSDDTSSTESTIAQFSFPPLLRFKTGDLVQVFLKGVWAKGKVTKIWDQGHPYCVELEDGLTFWVPKEILNCIRDTTPLAATRFNYGDKVYVNHCEKGGWQPGEIIMVWDGDNPYRIELEDGTNLCVPKDDSEHVEPWSKCINFSGGISGGFRPRTINLLTAMNVISPLTKQLISAAPVQSLEKVQNVPVLWIQQRLHVAQQSRGIGSIECLNTETGEVSFQGTLIGWTTKGNETAPKKVVKHDVWEKKHDVWVWDKVLNNPKNPSSAYGCYSGRIWPIQSSEDMANELKAWRSMSKAEKSKYENMAEQDMIRYANELMMFTAAKSKAVASFQKSRSGATLTPVLPSKKAMNESLVQSEASFQKSRSGATLTPVLTLKKAMTESLIQYQPSKCDRGGGNCTGDSTSSDAGWTFQSISYNTLNSVSKTPLSHEELRCAELGIIEFEKREENVNVSGSASGEKKGSVFDEDHPPLHFVLGDLIQVYIKKTEVHKGTKWHQRIITSGDNAFGGSPSNAFAASVDKPGKSEWINGTVIKRAAQAYHISTEFGLLTIPYIAASQLIRERKKNIQFTSPASGSIFSTQTGSGAFTFGSNDGNASVFGNESNTSKPFGGSGALFYITPNGKVVDCVRPPQKAEKYNPQHHTYTSVLMKEELDELKKQNASFIFSIPPATATSSTHALPTSSIAVPATIPTNTEVSLKTTAQLPNTTKKDTATKNTTTNDFTILYLMEADEEIKLRAKINSGSSPNSCNSAEQSALHVAAVWDAVDCGRLLIEHGADVNATNSVEVFGAQTPLMIAAMRGNIKFGKLLIEHGCDVTSKSAHGSLADDFLDKTHKNYVEFHELLLPTTLLQEEAKEEERKEEGKEEGKEEQEEDLFVSDSSL